MPRRIEIRSEYFSDEECSQDDDDSYSYKARRSETSSEDYEEYSDEDGFDISISKSNNFEPESEPEPTGPPYIILATQKEIKTHPRGWGWMMSDYPKTILRMIPTEETSTAPPPPPSTPPPPSSPPPPPAPIWSIVAPIETKSVMEISSEQEKEKDQQAPRRILDRRDRDQQAPRRLLSTGGDRRDRDQQAPRRLLSTTSASASASPPVQPQQHRSDRDRDRRHRDQQPPRRLLSTTSAGASASPPVQPQQQRSDRDRNGVAKPELLCIHGPSHISNKSCNMAHKWSQWEPKTCRFTKCRSGAGCIFWHKQSETLQQYFQRSLQNQGSFFFKNKEVYLKNYPI